MCVTVGGCVSVWVCVYTHVYGGKELRLGSIHAVHGHGVQAQQAVQLWRVSRRAARCIQTKYDFISSSVVVTLGITFYFLEAHTELQPQDVSAGHIFPPATRRHSAE